MHNHSGILDETKAKKLISYFPEGKKNFTFVKIYDPQLQGWRLKDFNQRVFNQGATLIILQTSEGKICGGFTTKTWGNYDGYLSDSDAFVFNIDNKYTPSNNDKAIYALNNGGF